MEISDPVFTTLRLNPNGPLFLDSHVSRLERAYAVLFGTALMVDLDDLEKSLSIISQSRELPCLVRIQVHQGGEIAMIPRPLEAYESSIHLITQPLPGGIRDQIRYKQGDWEAYSNTRRNAITNGGDAALLVDQDMIIDGDTFTPLFAFTDGEFVIPDPMMGAVESITLRNLEHYFGKRIRINQRKVALADLSMCLDALAVGTGIGIRRIASIDGISLGSDLEAGLEDILCEIEDVGFIEGLS